MPDRTPSESIKIEQADAREFVADISDSSVDLVVADYPFDCDETLVRETAEAFQRILKPDGNLAVINNPHNCFAYLDAFSERFTLRNRVVLPKADPLYPAWHLGMAYNELWFLYNGDRGRWNGSVKNHQMGLTDIWNDRQYYNGYWDGDYYHPQAIPEWVARRIIELCSDPWDRVVDPFVGSGTVPFVCARRGRECVGCDRNEEHVRQAMVRVSKAPADVTTYTHGRPGTEGDA